MRAARSRKRGEHSSEMNAEDRDLFHTGNLPQFPGRRVDGKDPLLE
jgi:hypothetical protein